MKKNDITISNRAINLLRALADWMRTSEGLAFVGPPTRDQLDGCLHKYEEVIPARSTRLRYERMLERANLVRPLGSGVHRRVYLTTSGANLVRRLGPWDGGIVVEFDDHGPVATWQDQRLPL